MKQAVNTTVHRMLVTICHIVYQLSYLSFSNPQLYCAVFATS